MDKVLMMVGVISVIKKKPNSFYSNDSSVSRGVSEVPHPFRNTCKEPLREFNDLSWHVMGRFNKSSIRLTIGCHDFQ